MEYEGRGEMITGTQGGPACDWVLSGGERIRAQVSHIPSCASALAEHRYEGQYKTVRERIPALTGWPFHDYLGSIL
jgi:hypothetical protein